VLDVSQVMAGPFASMLLVIWARRDQSRATRGGDQTRRAMGFKLKGNDSLGFFNLNRNKRSVALNLKNKAAREAFYRWSRPPTFSSRITGPESRAASVLITRRCQRSIRVLFMRASPASARRVRGRSGQASI